MKKSSKTWLSITLAVIVLVGIIVIGVSSGNDRENTPASIATSGQIGLNVGDLAPDFTIQTIDEQTVSLASFKDKKALVITTTASWCPTCIIEAEQFAPVYPQFKDSTEFLSVSIDPTDDRLKLEAFKTNNNTPWLYTEPKLAGVRDMILTYQFDRFEITYVLDKDGVIRFKDRGITSTEVLREELEKLQGKVAAEALGEQYSDQGQQHITAGETHPRYNSNPPTSGWHYAQPADWGMYSEELPDEQVVHNLEHGGIWISYRPDISGEQKEILAQIASRYSSKVILSPRSANDEPVAVAAWQRLMKLKTPLSQERQGRIVSFIARYKNKGPEFIPDMGV